MGVGGAVTTLSDPHRELTECVTKATPILRSVRAELREPVLPDVRMGSQTNPTDPVDPVRMRRRTDSRARSETARFARVLVLSPRPEQAISARSVTGALHVQLTTRATRGGAAVVARTSSLVGRMMEPTVCPSMACRMVSAAIRPLSTKG